MKKDELMDEADKEACFHFLFAGVNNDESFSSYQFHLLAFKLAPSLKKLITPASSKIFIRGIKVSE